MKTYGNMGTYRATLEENKGTRTPPRRASESTQSILLGENDKMLLKEKLKSIEYTHLKRFLQRNS